MKTIYSSGRVVGVSVCAMGLLTGALQAAESHHWMRDQGTIEQVEPQAERFIVRDSHFATLTVGWDHHTRFFERGEPVIGSDLWPGEHAVITYRRDGDRLVAKRVVVRP